MHERIFAFPKYSGGTHIRPAYSYINCETFGLGLTAPCKGKKKKKKKKNPK
jgi:hypothetical protein